LCQEYERHSDELHHDLDAYQRTQEAQGVTASVLLREIKEREDLIAEILDKI
jgi:hypothetical protein